MSVYDPRRRLRRALLTAAVFCAVYVAFRSLTSSYLDVERDKKNYASPQRVLPGVDDARRDARMWFADQPWVADSGKYFRDRGRYLFCQTLQLSSDRKTILVRPLAMLWRAAPGDVPIRIVADSATLYAEDEFQLDGSDTASVRGGVLSGNVRIRGPDNLRLNGGTFHLDQRLLKLWSSEPVECTWDRHTGRCDSGVEIYFRKSAMESGGTEAIERLQLLGRVQFRFRMPGQTLNAEPNVLHVQAARGFVFDNSTSIRTGTFSGFAPTGRANPSVRLNPRREVWVKRVNADGSTDELICPELRLTFRDGTDPVTGAPDSSTLQPEHLQAWGRRVEVYSSLRNVSIVANDIQYSVDRRQIDIRNTANSVTDRKKFVVVRQGKSLLTVPHLRLLHTADNRLQRLECNGAGGFRAVAESAARSAGDTDSSESRTGVIEARWGESMVFQSSADGAEQYLTLSGGGAIGELSRQLGLSARKITLTLAGQSVPPAQEGSSTQTAAPFESMFSQIEPRLLTASGDVLVRSPAASGKLRNLLTVRFLQPPADRGVVKTVSATRPDAELASASTSAGEAAGPAAAENLDNQKEEPLYFTCESGDAEVELGGSLNEVPAYRVWLNGDIDVRRTSGEPDKMFTASGNQLVAVSSASAARTIQLFGDPARVSGQARNLEGPRIDLHELDGRAKVLGSGRIRFLTTQGIDGRELTEPAPMDIYWSDNMEFQNRSARFHGKVRVVLSDGETQDVQLLCAGLSVFFAAAVSLNPTDDREFEAVPSAAGGATDESKSLIERLHCHDRVRVTIDQFDKGQLVGRHKALLTDLKVNLSSGDFSAIGPGYLESVAPDREGRLQGTSSVTVRPNSPSRTHNTAFVYLRTEFVGDLTGNIHQQSATLSQNVIALMAPTPHVNESVNIYEIPTAELPERAGILQAEVVTFSAIPGTDDRPASFSIDCRRNARLESRSISANADVITYDHSKEQFIIRAEGDGKVVVNHRRGAAGKFSRTSGSRFEYYRQTNQLKADQIDRLNLSE